MYPKSILSNTLWTAFWCICMIAPVGSQHWIPLGLDVLPEGYGVYSIASPQSNVIWVNASKTDVVNGIDPVPLDHLITIMRSDDGGVTWDVHEVEESIGRVSFDILATSATTAWITTNTYGNGTGLRLFNTTDGGITWEEKYFHASAGVMIRQFDDQHFILQNSDAIATSSNGGSTWDTLFIPGYLPNEFNTLTSGNMMSDVVGDTLWSGTSLGRIFRFTDYGQAYQVFYIGAVHAINSIAFSDHLHGMLTYHDYQTQAYGIYRTSDGGATWSVPPALPATAFPYGVTNIPGTGTFMVASNYLYPEADYLWTTDFGNTWSPTAQIADENSNALLFTSPTSGWLSTFSNDGSNQPLIYSWSGDIFTSVEGIPAKALPMEVWPVPAKDVLHFSLPEENAHAMHYTLYTITGQMIRSGELHDHEVVIEDLTPGVYSVILEQHDKVFGARFSKQ